MNEALLGEIGFDLAPSLANNPPSGQTATSKRSCFFEFFPNRRRIENRMMPDVSRSREG
jgi:hypothetical protein